MECVIKNKIDINTAAEYLGYHPQTLRNMASSGKIPALKRGAKWFFEKSDLDKLIQTNNPANDSLFKNI